MTYNNIKVKKSYSNIGKRKILKKNDSEFLYKRIFGLMEAKKELQLRLEKINKSLKRYQELGVLKNN